MNKDQQILDLYNEYVKEICSIKDIRRWTSKKTITASVLNPERTNEQKVYDAVKGIEGLQEGDKVQIFFKADRSLALEQDFNGDYDQRGLLEKLFKSALIFEDLYPVREKLLNYALKRSQDALKSLIEAPEAPKIPEPSITPKNTPKSIITRENVPGFDLWSFDKAWNPE